MKYFRFFPFLLTLVLILPLCARAEVSVKTRQNEFSLQRGHLAIQGYDPVSYHQKNEPRKGSKHITVEYRGVVYRFVSEANKAKFLDNSIKFEPEYGGWCAWAMLDGDRTEPNPESYKVVDGKLYLFYDGLFGDTRKSWNEKAAETPEQKLIELADRLWGQQVD